MNSIDERIDNLENDIKIREEQISSILDLISKFFHGNVEAGAKLSEMVDVPMPNFVGSNAINLQLTTTKNEPVHQTVSNFSQTDEIDFKDSKSTSEQLQNRLLYYDKVLRDHEENIAEEKKQIVRQSRPSSSNRARTANQISSTTLKNNLDKNYILSTNVNSDSNNDYTTHHNRIQSFQSGLFLTNNLNDLKTKREMNLNCSLQVIGKSNEKNFAIQSKRPTGHLRWTTSKAHSPVYNAMNSTSTSVARSAFIANQYPRRPITAAATPLTKSAMALSSSSNTTASSSSLTNPLQAQVGIQVSGEQIVSPRSCNNFRSPFGNTNANLPHRSQSRNSNLTAVEMCDAKLISMERKFQRDAIDLQKRLNLDYAGLVDPVKY